MNNRLLSPKKIERHLQLWIYLLPIVGVIPAVWTLYRPQTNNQTNLVKNREQTKASRLSVNLALVWLVSYSLLSLGAAGATEVMSFRLLYANAILTSAYFVTCTILMSRLSSKKLTKINQVK